MLEYAWMDRLLDSEKESMTDKQVSIIKTAIELFSEKGYSATTTKEIAQRTGVAEGTIFRHYATKKELMLSITEMIITNLAFPIFTAGLHEVVNQPYDTLDDFLNSLMVNRLAMMQQAIPLIKFMLQEVPFQPEIRDLIIKNLDKVPLAEGLDKFKQRGLIIDLPTEQLVKLIFTNFFGFLSTRYIILPELFSDNLTEDIDAFIHFMARGLAATQ